MAKYRKAPRSEWLGYPQLKLDDVEHDFFKHSRFLAQSLVDNRKGRVNLVIDHPLYQDFLSAVRKKFGNIDASSVNEAATSAMKAWVAEVNKE
jgi:RNA-binding protein YlmH